MWRLAGKMLLLTIGGLLAKYLLSLEDQENSKIIGDLDGNAYRTTETF
jgi:hypothetical protein